MKRLLWIAALASTVVFAQEKTPEPGAGHEPAAKEEPEPSPLWKWANFAILAGLIGYGISKGAGAFFTGRDQEIRQALLDAEQVHKQAEARSAEIDRRMANLENEIQDLRAHSRREMQAESERLHAETSRAAQRVEENAQQEIASALKHAINELRNYSSQLAVNLAQRKIEARMNPDIQGALVDEFVTMLRRPRGSVN